MTYYKLILLAAISSASLVSCGDANSPPGTQPSNSASKSTSSAMDMGTTRDRYAELIDRARSYIAEWNREDPLCDVIEAPNLDSIQRGTVTFIATRGGKVEPPIPAIVARIAGTCVINSQRKREPITKFWMMMAQDKAFNKFTCIKIGGEDLIRGFIESNCEFIPNNGEKGLIDSPNPQSSAAQQPIANSNAVDNSQSKIDGCVKQKIATFRKEHGEDAPIRHDVLEEWTSECASQGK